MSVVISGALIDGAGIPMSGCHIILKSRVNTSEVVMRTKADVVTGNNGEYSFEAQVGKYCVYLRQDWRDEHCVGDIAVYDDSRPGTLNDFLTALDEGDLKPDVVKRFEELVAQAQQSAEAAAESERQAGQHAADAQKIKGDCQTLADNVQQNTNAVEENTQRVEQLASQVEDTASEVRQDAEAAKKAASDAEQARDDIDVALSATLKTANHLSEIAAEGEDAQQESRGNLGLKSAATMEPQNDTHDRTPGRLAIPGMFGFGKVFGYEDRVVFRTRSALLAWAKTAKPGRYHCFGDIKDLIPGLPQIYGIIEVIWPYDSTGSAVENVSKTLIYNAGRNLFLSTYVPNGDGWLTDWENLNGEASLRALIETRAPLKSPALTGTPSTPTPPDDAAGTEIANAAFVRKLLAALVGSSPEALDTLNELAAALGNDPEFATTITNALAGKQPLNDVLTTISNLEERADNLLCFNQDGSASLSPLSEKARSLLAQDTPEAMRQELELAASATMEPQSDIYDRTEGRLAIPGAFGFGSLFFYKDKITFKTSGEFSDWVRTAKPGRYAVYGADKVIPGVLFSGIVEIIWPGPLSSNYDPKYTAKIAIFYGVNGEIYYARGNSGPIGAWESWKLDTSDLIAPLQSTTGNSWGSPDIGGLIFGAYFGESDTDNNRKMKRGQAVSGSRVGMVTISAKGSTTGAYASSAQFVTVSPNSYPQAGAFIALSGSHLTTLGSSECFVGLFMRVV
ncbi:prophage tail fiber N-terminal domain-containing protein [Escherichia coli]|nr:prophage tail fiber N-terminal domain-containing protein [Escherichia coli]